MAVGPLGEPPHQPVLRGQDEAPVLLKVGVLEHTQQLEGEKGQRSHGHSEQRDCSEKTP